MKGLRNVMKLSYEATMVLWYGVVNILVYIGIIALFITDPNTDNAVASLYLLVMFCLIKDIFIGADKYYELRKEREEKERK